MGMDSVTNKPPLLEGSRSTHAILIIWGVLASEAKRGRFLVLTSPFELLLSLMPVKQMRQMRLCSHMQPFCNPCVSHRRFPPQAQGHSDLFRIPFSPFAQLCLLPLQFPELLLNHSLGLCFSRLPNLLPVMLRPSLLVHLRQQFLTESFV